MIGETLKQLSLKVSQYFLDFLESDFKRQQAPRRRVILQTASGFKAGMPLSPYRTLLDAVWHAISKPWEESEISITPRAFTKTLSQPLRLILKEQVGALSREQLEPVIVAVVQQAKKTLPKAVSHPEEWVALVRQELADNIGSHIVRPMLAFVDAALKDQAYSSIDSIFNAEGDLIGALAEPLDAQLPEVLARFSVSRDVGELTQTSIKLLNLEFVRPALSTFFESFAASDAFLEFRDLETYVSTSEGNQLYLYIGTIKYGSAIYPMLYVPIETRRDDQHGTYTLKFGNQLYANKRAVDFVLQELGSRQQRQTLSPIPERITYLSTAESIAQAVSPIFKRITHAYGFTDDLQLASGPVTQLTDTQVSISNGLYFCAFEKSDEALLNDYEEMISQIRNNKPGVVELYQSIIQGVIEGNPVSIDAAIDKLWSARPIDLRAVPDTPIPLNEEQQKILQAIHHDEGRIIVVEGPPGTGKSHTIVAIAADCAFRKKSCLVLSDKPEALEVVHNKLSSAMNEVRGSDDFPNPLLRLGTEHANFKRLTSATTITQVAAQVKATRANRSHLECDRDQRRQSLREQIGSVIRTYGAIKTQEIHALERLGMEIDKLCGANLAAALDQMCELTPTAAGDTARPIGTSVELFLADLLSDEVNRSRTSMDATLATYRFAAEISNQVKQECFQECPHLNPAQLEQLTGVSRDVEAAKKPIIGWLFSRGKLAELASKCQNITTFRKAIEFPRDLAVIKGVISNGHHLKAAISAKPKTTVTFESAYSALGSLRFPLAGLSETSHFVVGLNKLPNSPALEKLYTASPAPAAARLWTRAMAYAIQMRYVCQQFASAPPLEYVARKTEVEKLNTALMNAEVDSRLIEFMEASRADAKVLAKLIKEKQKFPEDKFETVKQAFPVMIASIREFGEYMPLKKDLLDVLVIDEASQVSIAQAFPAMLRAKKIVIMGDTNQFANTKASNASIALNQKHRSELEGYFKQAVSSDVGMLERLSYFDITRSVLEFGQLSANYRIMLRKHFRSYKELIHYSSSTFYGGQLQAIKIRTVPLAHCIEFNELAEPTEKAARNTNPAEADFILSRCTELLEEESPPSVGVITPFREQQSYVSRLFANDALAAEFRSRLKIKVMTFDSCQGEERNLIFYSMVATKSQDLLNYIFPVKLENPDELIGEKLKMQRLNVGFSRAQDAVSFVLSKPLAEFKGSIGQALRHFETIGKTHQADSDDTDPLSPMEKKVLEWIYATPFYQLRMESIEVLPQFPLGDYLRQLDPTYKHPSWRVDFLITISSDNSVIYVVIEYDGFEYHFKKGAPVDVSNHERYLHEADVERQLTLESYGYRFLRLNRFNLGTDPIARLSERLEQFVASAARTDSTGAVRIISQQAEALTDKSAKLCERCGEIKPMALFYDKSLGGGSGGNGRICLPCKQIDSAAPKFKQRFGGRRRWR
ncbi:MAG TPA: AAA domain-containing protein [Steroidobacteraceae bacterium]